MTRLTGLMPQQQRAGAQQATTTMTMELYDFGADVEVDVPPRSQVTTLEELMKLTNRQGTG